MDIVELTKDFRARGLRVKAVHVEGRFHSSAHSAAAEKLKRLCGTVEEMQFPTVDKVRVPLRSAVNRETITGGSLHGLAIEMMLLKTADWYGVMKTAVRQIPAKNPVIVFSGFGDHIPASLLQNSSLQVVLLGSPERTHVQRLAEASWHDSLDNGIPLNETSVNGTFVNGIPVKSIPFNGASVNGAFANSASANRTSRFTNGASTNIQSGGYQYPQHSVAIVGMSCRLPGADSVDDFWQLLLSGASMVEPAPAERLKLHSLRGGERVDAKRCG